jgi:hypothetical protein
VIATPLDNTVPGNDADFFLAGKSELSRAEQQALLGHGIPFSGHILDLPRGGANVVQVKN